MAFTLVLTTLALFGMWVACWMAVLVPVLLSLSRMDLIFVTGRMLRLRGLDNVRITKVKGHADEVMDRDGRVRELHRVGNNAADDAADFGRPCCCY